MTKQAQATAATAASTKKPVAVVEVTTQPLRKAHTPRVVAVPKGSRVNRHYNQDGSITLYAAGIKIFRTATEEEGGDDFDADAEAEKFLKKWFGKKEFVFGKTTHGHNWKAKAKATEEEAPAPKAKRTRKAAAKAPAAKRTRKPKAAPAAAEAQA